jgi:protein phosphatase 1B
MGSFLDRPKTEKETHHIEGHDLKAGMSAMQGWRVDMEVGKLRCLSPRALSPTRISALSPPPALQDAHSMVVGIDGAPGVSWFAVFDGHGGGYTSKYASEKVLGKITATPEWQADNKSPDSIAKALTRGFLELDADLLKTPEIMGGDDHSGSTAITSFVTPTHVIVGNCGDSRAILVRDGAVSARAGAWEVVAEDRGGGAPPRRPAPQARHTHAKLPHPQAIGVWPDRPPPPPPPAPPRARAPRTWRRAATACQR